PICRRVGGTTAKLGVAFPNRLVRRVALDADPDYPRHPHQSDSLSSKLGELAVDRDDGCYHAHRCLAAFFAPWACVRLHSIAAHVLAHHGCDVARLCVVDARRENLAISEGVGYGIV